MNEASGGGETQSASRSKPKSIISPRLELTATADLIIAATGAAACSIRWRNSDREGTINVPAGLRWATIFDVLFTRFQTLIKSSAEDRDSVVHLRHAMLDPILAKSHPNGTRHEAFAKASECGSLRAVVVAVVPEGRDSSATKASLRLAAGAALRIVESHEAMRSRDFWRRRAVEIGERIARSRVEAARRDQEYRSIEDAAAAASKLKPGNRFAGLGTVFAQTGPFEAWIVAMLENDELRVSAASAVPAPISPLDGNSAIAESLRTNSTVRRSPGEVYGDGYDEDRLFARFASYVCVPFTVGAIGLASRQSIDAAVIARVETIARRLEPIVQHWHAEAQIEQLRRLVANLGFRMFGAVDAERARIARDLHDHQAQLLAAAKIALDAGPNQARRIFKQIEDALRLRLRELRPAGLGRSTLEGALRYELQRIAEAGIQGRIANAKRMNALTRPVQQLCYQVAREALSNVIRHSGATRVEINVEKRGRHVRLSILDNGRGMRDHAAMENGAARSREYSGMGLSGLSERLELMGGKLGIESREGSTRVIAEIPEPS